MRPARQRSYASVKQVPDLGRLFVYDLIEREHRFGKELVRTGGSTRPSDEARETPSGVVFSIFDRWAELIRRQTPLSSSTSLSGPNKRISIDAGNYIGRCGPAKQPKHLTTY
jgi:hypothetical protein